MLKCFEGLNDLMMVGQSVIDTRCKTIKNTFIKYFTLIIFHIRKTAIITSLIIKKDLCIQNSILSIPVLMQCYNHIPPKVALYSPNGNRFFVLCRLDDHFHTKSSYVLFATDDLCNDQIHMCL